MKRKMWPGFLSSLILAVCFCSCTKTSTVNELKTPQNAMVPALATQARTTICTNGQGFYIDANSKLNNNIFGAGTSGAGSQCMWYESSNGQWGVNATHSSGTAQNIKGYPAIARGWLWYNSTGSIWVNSGDDSYPSQLSGIQSLVSSWNVTVPANGEKYDTAYDIWIDPDSNPNHRAGYEIMIWINYKGPAYNGTDFAPIGTLVTPGKGVAGHLWNVYRGNNGSNEVLTYRRTINTNVVTNLDIRSILYDAKNMGFIQSSYYILGIQAGWEIVAGGSFTTNSYSTTLINF